MKKLLLFWLKKFNLLSRYLLKSLKKNDFSGKNFQKLGLFFATLILILGNSQLFIATIFSIAIMFLVYQWPELNWTKYWLQYVNLLQNSQKRLIISVSSGGVIAVTTYLTAVIWVTSENRWLATGAILQGLISVITLGLLGWQFFGSKILSNHSKLDQYLDNLASNSTLKRLIAVRYLGNLINNNSLNSNDLKYVQDYFQIMLKIESEPIIREHLKAILSNDNYPQLLKETSFFSQENQPLNILLRTKVLKNIYD